MLHFSYKGACGVCGHCMHINVLKEELASATDNGLGLLVISCKKPSV